MSEIKRRAPVAINLSTADDRGKSGEKPVRLPRNVSVSTVIVSPRNDFETAETIQSAQEKTSNAWPIGTVLVSGASALFALWLSSSMYLWIETLIGSNVVLGWIAAGLAALTVVALIGFLAREIIAVFKLSTNQNLCRSFDLAKQDNNTFAARQAVKELLQKVSELPATMSGRTSFAAYDQEFFNAADLMSLAERDLMSPLDKMAVEQVFSAAKRVSIVTAISPRAFVDIAYVVYENAKLVRRIAEIYGCRPGLFGFLRLSRETLAHLAVTGAIAVGDSMVQQIVGHGMAARVSAKLGEGVLNGLMTARIGFAAMDVTRPMPFSDGSRPKISQVLSHLNPISAKQSSEA